MSSHAICVVGVNAHCLWYENDCTSCASVVGQKSGQGNNTEDDMLLRPRPVERIIRIIAGLRYEARATIQRHLDSTLVAVSGLDNVAFFLFKLMKSVRLPGCSESLGILRLLLAISRVCWPSHRRF